METSRIVAVQVIYDKEVVLDWFALKVSKELTFAKLFEDICAASRRGEPGGRFKHPISLGEKTYSACYVKATPHAPEVEVSWNLPITETLSSFGSNHILIKCKDVGAGSVQEDINNNAFKQLMEGQKRLQANLLKYPDTFGQDGGSRGDWRLKNEFIGFLKEKNLGFYNGEEKTCGKTMVNMVCDCLYYILPHLAKLSSRCIELNPLFHRFYNTSDFSQDYNDPQRYKNKVKALERNDLSHHAQNLYKSLTFPFMTIQRFAALQDAVLELADKLSKHVEYMGKQNERVMTIHNLPHPARSPDDDISTKLRHIPGKLRSYSIVERYEYLEKALNEVPEYTPVLINDICELARKKRYFYLQDLQLPYDITVYTYCGGGPSESLHFVWKCGKMLDLQKANIVIHDIEKDIPKYHTRAMQTTFSSRFSLLCKVHPAILNEMYRYLTGDSSAPSCQLSKEVSDRLLIALDSGDPSITFDMRSIHEIGSTKFETFFDEVGKLINEYELKAVDDRRHGLISHLAVAMSVRDLHQQVSARVPEGTNIPSIEWLRLQFMPKNPSLTAAVQYTGKFPLKFRVQSRQFNTFHEDAHYASALQRYLKEFVVQYKDHCVLLSIDDKNHIPVGEPGTPIATIYRNKKSVSHTNIPHVAADHDTASKCKITPSVILQIDKPDLITGDFYNGQVSVTLKDTIFQPSNPMRHIAEIRKFLSQTGKIDLPFRVIYSDWGPDHRLTFPSVKLSLIALFLMDDSDYLLAVRTAPHQSYRNWVERIMSILNLGLQTVALERRIMPPDFDFLMKKGNTMASIRNLADKNSSFREELLSSMQPMMQTLSDIFGRLNLKGRSFMTGDPASDTLIEELWHTIHQLDATDPMPGSEGKFLPFSTVYGFSTSEEHCPSLKKSCDKTCGQWPCKQTAETIRSCVLCIECQKPRCIYSAKRMSKDQQDQLALIMEEGLYTCGGILIPEDHTLYAEVFVEPNINCQSPVATHYFARHLFKPVCFNCGSENPEEIAEEWKRNFQTVHPICTYCREEGLTERTRGNRNLKRKR